MRRLCVPAIWPFQSCKAGGNPSKAAIAAEVKAAKAAFLADPAGKRPEWLARRGEHRAARRNRCPIRNGAIAPGRMETHLTKAHPAAAIPESRTAPETNNQEKRLKDICWLN